MLFASLFISVTYIQVVAAKELEDHPRNLRTIAKERSRERGQILAGTKVIANSKAVEDSAYPFLREYPNGQMYAPVTGYYALLSGTYGLENAENSYLSGTADELFLRSLTTMLTGEQPKGASVETTIVPAAQKAAWDALGDQRGAAVALDPKTGDILAMVSKPSYNPNKLSTHDTTASRDERARLNADELEPLINRSIAQLYPPGSTFKIVTAAAALSNGDYAPDSENNIDGSTTITLPQTTATISNSGMHACGDGSPTLLEAFADSCNTTFARMAMDLGQDIMQEQAAKFGFGQELTVPQTVAKSSFAEGELNEPQLAQSGIGQYEVRTTPLQVAMLSAGVANDGVVMRPNLVKRIFSADGKTVSERSPEELSEAVTSDVADQLTEMMTATVREGTATNAQISGIEVAGKTGTAQNQPGENPHAWFTAFAPADDPQVAVAVVVERGGNAGSEASGGRVAAPIAKAVMEAVIK
nr:penicillin-binding protein 2 [Kineosporia babensis]